MVAAAAVIVLVLIQSPRWYNVEGFVAARNAAPMTVQRDHRHHHQRVAVSVLEKSRRKKNPRQPLFFLLVSTNDPLTDGDDNAPINGAATTTLTSQQSPAVASFLSHLCRAVDDQTLLSLTLWGPSKKLVRQWSTTTTDSSNRNNVNTANNYNANGSLRMVVARPIVLDRRRRKNNNPPMQQQETTTAAAEPRHLQLTYKYHGATDICKNIPLPSSSIATDDGSDENTYNNTDVCLTSLVLRQHDAPDSEWGPVPHHALGSTRGWHRATLETTVGTEYELVVVATSSKKKKNKATPKLLSKERTNKSNNSFDSSSSTHTQQSQIKNNHKQNLFTHDRVKQGPVDRTAPVWKALGVTTAQGRVQRGMSSKLKQCQKFVEIVDGLVAANCYDCDSVHIADKNSVATTATATRPPLSVVDMGCGRGYLTFALHSHLYRTYNSNVVSRGIDVRPKLVREISGVAESLGPEFAALRFETGTIESFLAECSLETTMDSTADSIALDPQPPRHEPAPSTHDVDVLIALHACDTATDDALWSGICRKAAVLVVAPCCHRQVRPQLDKNAAATATTSSPSSSIQDHHPYADILRHPIYRERMAETVTDALRALLLEAAGYTVQVFEFVGGEHTSKNVMLTAVRKESSTDIAATAATLPPTAGVHPMLPPLPAALHERIRALAALHGIRDQKLASWMGISLISDDEQRSNNGKCSSTKKATPLTARSMPPLPK